MKLFISIILTIFILAAAGCGAKYYKVTTKAGDVYTAKGALQYNVEEDTYTFENAEGKEVVLNKEEIDAIMEK